MLVGIVLQASNIVHLMEKKAKNNKARHAFQLLYVLLLVSRQQIKVIKEDYVTAQMYANAANTSVYIQLT